MFKLSTYVSSYKIDNNKKVLLHNSRTGKVITLDNKSFDILKSVHTVTEFYDNINKLKIDSSIIRDFFSNDDEDKIEVYRMLHEIKYNDDRLIITIMTTMDCNMKCEYCYQNNLVNRSLYIDEKMAIQIKDWVLKKINSLNPKNVIIHFYGGEPMLNIDILKIVIPPIMKKCEETNIMFSTYMTSNGTILGANHMNMLKKWKIENIQISIDGTREYHDKRRPLINGIGTYDIIMRNVKNALDNDLKIVIRINIDKHNIKNIEDFFKDLRSRNFHKYDKLQINLEIVSPITNPTDHCKKYVYYSDEEMADLKGLWNTQVKYGFPIKSSMPIDSACEHSMMNSYTISPEGSIYMCPGFVGLDNFIIGNINNVQDILDLDRFLKIDHWKSCIDCEYLPICQGGCKMCAYVTSGKYDSVYCRKKFIKSIYKEFLVSKYKIEQEKI